MKPGIRRAVEHEIEKAEFIAAIQNALDLHYHSLREAARADWERLFGSDPADECVTVRVQTTAGSGFLKSRRQAASKSHVNGSVRFAH